MNMNIEIYRHSASHILAQAVKELYPDVRLGIGPAIDNGFYYDFERRTPFQQEDLAKIEAKMSEIIKRDIPFIRKEVDKEEAKKMFADLGEKYKLELIDEIPEEKVTVYAQDKFIDLCRGPHAKSTGEIKAFKLLSVAGAYWRGDATKPMLQRIYGTAFNTEKELRKHLHNIEEAKKRDHRSLGQKLGLFLMREEAGAGFVIYQPNGGMIRHLLEEYERKEHLRRGYKFVYGPTILKKELWERSGHYEHYRELMYFTRVGEEEYAIKPMNCISHMLIFKSRIRSYRDLPIRLFELGTVHRHEKSGVLHGLLRVRAFTQDDAHIFCREDQMVDEIKGVLDLVKDVMAVFNFTFTLEISTRPGKSIGRDEDWDKATSALKEALEDKKLPYKINEGEGAFYGPKIDVILEDAIKRKWQCATIQCDFTMPERFDLHFTNNRGEKERPIMLHRVIFGALERFIGILIEHYAGAFPLWLAPVQVKILTISEKYNTYANEIAKSLSKEEVRYEVDLGDEKIGYKIRQGRLQKIPYLVIVGEREVKDNSLSLRSRERGDEGKIFLSDFLKRLKEEVDLKK
ncbi:MAG: threonine--tRNA ligase [Candidatus Omnitrophica bacterium]|nr:threonine--tRNA ligase [Candidatus Omnitrophota bacterium]